MLNTINRAELLVLLNALNDGEHSNRLEVFGAENWLAPKVTVIDS